MDFIQKQEYIRAWQEQSQIMHNPVAHVGLIANGDNMVEDLYSNAGSTSASVSAYQGTSVTLAVEVDAKKKLNKTSDLENSDDLRDNTLNEGIVDNTKGKKDEDDREDDELEDDEEEEYETVASLPQPTVTKKRRDTAYKF
jgi:hypothetical protein